MQNAGQSWASTTNTTMGSVREKESAINYSIFSCNWDRLRVCTEPAKALPVTGGNFLKHTPLMAQGHGIVPRRMLETSSVQQLKNSTTAATGFYLKYSWGGGGNPYPGGVQGTAGCGKLWVRITLQSFLTAAPWTCGSLAMLGTGSQTDFWVFLFARKKKAGA